MNFDQATALNQMITSKLRSVGVLDHKFKIVKPITELPESEFKTWLLENIAIRDKAYAELGIVLKKIN